VVGLTIRMIQHLPCGLVESVGAPDWLPAAAGIGPDLTVGPFSRAPSAVCSCMPACEVDDAAFGDGWSFRLLVPGKGALPGVRPWLPLLLSARPSRGAIRYPR
jgi:hypothetical protein